MTATTLRRLIVLGLIVLWEALPRSYSGYSLLPSLKVARDASIQQKMCSIISG